jgi:nucleoside-diphosphate kinase
MEQTLVIIKPDGVKKGLTIDEILQDTDLHVIAQRQHTASLFEAQQHYLEHKDEHFYPRICAALSSGPIIIMVVEGVDAVKQARKRIGSRSRPDTIRGKYSNPGVNHENAIHGSDSVESAKREIALWF